MEKENNKLKLTFGDINRNNLEVLRMFNNLTLPVRYPPEFYLPIMAKMRFGKFAYFNGLIVGAISWKYDFWEDEKAIYIMTVSVLDNYKRFGVATQLLEHMLEIHKDVEEIKWLTLHVIESNEPALKFYEKHGFEKAKYLENYYPELNPKNAYYLKKKYRN